MYNQHPYNSTPYNSSLLMGDMDMQDSIVFNGYSLQNESIVITQMVDDNTPTRAMEIQDRPRANGQVFLNAFWRNKRITMKGWIKKPTKDLLERELDIFKLAMSQIEGVLDIRKGSTTRRYIASQVSTNLFSERTGRQITICPFSIEFECLTPFGSDTEYISTAFLDQTGLLVQEQVTNQGTADALPIITFNISTATDITGLTFHNLTTKEQISITTALVSGDYLRIDAEKLEVTLNGVVLDYDGVFPSLRSGQNAIRSELLGTSASYTETIKFLTPYL